MPVYKGVSSVACKSILEIGAWIFAKNVSRKNFSSGDHAILDSDGEALSVFDFTIVRDKPAYSPSVISRSHNLNALRTPPKLKVGTHRFFFTSYFTCAPEKVFDFFSDPRNLRKTTPPEIGFSLLSPETTRMGEGTVLSYRIRLAGIPFGWKTRMLSWDPPATFMDKQVKGPFSFWKHKHLIADERWRVRMDDEVLYRLPFWPLGEVAYPWVAGQLERIFTYRRSVMQSLLNE